MGSRMDRYHTSSSENYKRSRRNENLYDTIYSDDIEYSNVEGIAKIEKTNEIDLNRIREMLRKEEEKKKSDRFKPVFKKSISFPDSSFDEERKESRNYDIRDILSQAKKDKDDEESDKYRDLKNTQYNILKKIKLDDEIIKREPTEIEESDQLKELIHTITNTSLLNKINDNDLSLDLLEDLKSDNSNTATINKTSIKQILDKEKGKQDTNPNESNDYDKSFFTSSLNFNDDDFEELKEISSTYRRNNRLIKILISIIVIAVIIMIALFFINMPK